MSWQRTITLVVLVAGAVVAAALHQDHLSGVLAGAAAGLIIPGDGDAPRPSGPHPVLSAATRMAPVVGAIGFDLAASLIS